MNASEVDSKTQIFTCISQMPAEERELAKAFIENNEQTIPSGEIRDTFFENHYRWIETLPLLIQFNGTARYLDREYFLSEQRKKFIPGLYFSEESRASALKKAQQFEEEFIKPLLSQPGARFISGGIKSSATISNKIQRPDQEYQYLLKDFVRGKIVCKGLDEAIAVITKILEKAPDRIVCYENYYMYPYYSEQKEDFTFYLGCKFVFKLDDMIPYELQVLTERASIIGEINHDTVFKQNRDNPLSPEESEYISFLSWLAHALDYEDFRNLQAARESVRNEEEGHVWHCVKNKKIVHMMLATIEEQLKQSPVLDHKKAFTETLVKIFQYAVNKGWPTRTTQIVEQKKDLWADQFIGQLKDDEFNDLVYHDIRDGALMKKLLENAGEVDLWTKGDYQNGYQLNKLHRSGIIQMLDCIAENSSVRRNDILSDNKEKAISQTLESFWQGLSCPSQIMVTVYDDSEKVLFKAKKEIETWQGKQNAENQRVQVLANYVRSHRGSNENKDWDDVDDFEYVSAYRFDEFVECHTRMADIHHISRNQCLVLMDFDGTLANNELASVRKCKRIYSGLMKAVKLVARELIDSGTAPAINDPAAQIAQKREEIRQLYESIQDLWKRKIHKRRKNPPIYPWDLTPDLPLGLFPPQKSKLPDSPTQNILQAQAICPR